MVRVHCSPDRLTLLAMTISKPNKDPRGKTTGYSEEKYLQIPLTPFPNGGT
jgi:hypothetical protein